MQIDVVAAIYDESFKEEHGIQTIHLEDKKVSFAVPLTSPLAEKRRRIARRFEADGSYVDTKGSEQVYRRPACGLRKCERKNHRFQFFQSYGVQRGGKKQYADY